MTIELLEGKIVRQINIRKGIACLVIWLGIATDARAQWAVVDAPAIVQLIKEVQTMQQQLTTARSQLLQAQQTLQSTTGDRGMAQLLGTIDRNYLPIDWVQVASVLQNAPGYAALSADTRKLISANAVLSSQRMGTLPESGQQLIQSQRQWGAMQQALAHQALANASTRFASLQTLITSIAGAQDQKAILELNARISAELAMLQNEQTKVQVLNQSAVAQAAALNLQAREQILNNHGRFDTRFQPVP